MWRYLEGGIGPRRDISRSRMGFSCFLQFRDRVFKDRNEKMDNSFFVPGTLPAVLGTINLLLSRRRKNRATMRTRPF